MGNHGKFEAHKPEDDLPDKWLELEVDRGLDKFSDWLRHYAVFFDYLKAKGLL